MNIEYLEYLILAAGAFCAFKIGYWYNKHNSEDIIEATIMALVDKNLVRWKRDSDGEIELLPIDHKD